MMATAINAQLAVILAGAASPADMHLASQRMEKPY
jgi:hypothetical protein